MKLLANLFTGLVLGGVIVVGVIAFEGELKFFWASAMIGVIIWMASLFATKKSDDNIIDILNRVKRIEERLDGLYKK